MPFFSLNKENNMIKEEKQIINLDQDREISISTGKLAKQAHGSVELRMEIHTC